MLLLLLLWVGMMAQLIVIAIVPMVDVPAICADAIIASTDLVAKVDGRDMVLMGMRMVYLRLLLIVIMMRWELRLLTLVVVLVAVIVMMMGHLKMQLMIHAATVNRARNWGHVLLRLDFQWTQ